MKFKFLLFSLALGGLSLFSSCEKENDDKDTNSGSCSGSANFCMEYGAINISGNAVLKEPPGGRYRISWEKSGSVYESVELDIYGNTTGTYTIDTSEAPGSAFFQYYHATNGANNGISGTLTVSTFDPDGEGISGTFSVNTENGTKVTKGNFVKVKK